MERESGVRGMGRLILGRSYSDSSSVSYETYRKSSLPLHS